VKVEINTTNNSFYFELDLELVNKLVAAILILTASL